MHYNTVVNEPTQFIFHKRHLESHLFPAFNDLVTHAVLVCKKSYYVRMAEKIFSILESRLFKLKLKIVSKRLANISSNY